ncbi:hypothetical protein CHS0354_008451 [Potamilus streckersoni]|uniref:Major facilitator superfamily (MFS) profile domain-containing protein n=1 Tax=Potamilus streckersoni TaxID=2493646 RepID=A0AAE0RPX7_9BIVA|nr:hypothetical protein CHS0354_008451 [Potamilus streckersoni]
MEDKFHGISNDGKEGTKEELNAEISYDLDDKETSQPITPVNKVTLRLALAVFSAVMGSLVFGYNTGVINAPEGQIKSFINKTNMDRSGEYISEDTSTGLFALIVAIFAVGGMIGGLLAGWWADFFGRKFGLIINNLIGIAAAVMMYISRTAGAYEVIIAGRFLVGINCGLYTGLTPLYLSEISTASMRGAIGVLHQLGVVIGLLTSQVLGFPEICGNENYWHLLLGLCIVPCVIQILTMPVCPESPRYLLIRKNREDEAKKALVILRGTDLVDEDMEEMKAEFRHQETETRVNLIKLFKKRSLRMPLLVSVVMQLSQQLSGINAIFYYSFNLFKSAGMEESVAAHATSGVGGTMVLMTLVTIPLMDRVGRRTLHLLGLGGMFLFSVLITITLALTYLADWLKIVNIVASLFYVVFFALGPGSIPWLIVAELFSQGPRPAALSVSVLVNWMSNFAVGYAFPYMQKGLNDYSFLPFSALLALFWIFTFKFVPETKNRTFEDIATTWKDKSESPVSSQSDLSGPVECKTDYGTVCRTTESTTSL